MALRRVVLSDNSLCASKSVIESDRLAELAEAEVVEVLPVEDADFD